MSETFQPQVDNTGEGTRESDHGQLAEEPDKPLSPEEREEISNRIIDLKNRIKDKTDRIMELGKYLANEMVQIDEIYNLLSRDTSSAIAKGISIIRNKYGGMPEESIQSRKEQIAFIKEKATLDPSILENKEVATYKVLIENPGHNRFDNLHRELFDLSTELKELEKKYNKI